jgi:tetratricopeptide (TPR) repeat protein
VSPRARTYVFVALAAVAASAVLVAAVAFTRTSSPHAQPAARPAPTLVLDLGVRTDREAVALRRANTLYAAGKRAEAGRIFARYRSVPAEVGAALAAWPDGTVARLERLADRHPSSALVLLHLGLARVGGGDTVGAQAAWRQALARDPDTEPAVQAESLLYPRFAPQRPTFVPSFQLPRAIAGLPAPRQFALLARDSRGGDVGAKLLYGSALQRLGRPVSAEREFAAAARLAPEDAEAQVAAAVGRFSKAKPAVAFSRLGPLARRFPHSQSVRFHLGELLIWIGQLKEARRQLGLAVAAGPSTQLGRTAREFLKQLPAK